MPDKLSYFGWNFCEIWLNSVQSFWSYRGYTACKGEDLWPSIETLNLGNRNQNLVLGTPSYFGLPFSEISIDLHQPFLSYCGYIICKGRTYDLWLWPWPWLCSTHFLILLYLSVKFEWIPFNSISIMAGTRFYDLQLWLTWVVGT